MRKEGWEDRFLAEIERHQQLPMQYGLSDCFMMAMDVAQACVDRELNYALDYDSKTSALKVMAHEGWASVGDAFASYFDPIAPAFAGRGDIGLVDVDGVPCGVIIVGNDVVGKHPEKGTMRLPRSMLVRAYRVE